MPESVLGAPVDADGLRIPELWQHSAKWHTLALTVRRKWSAEWVRLETEKAAKEAAKKPRTPRPPAKRFTTDYAVKLGQRRGWKLIDREHYDYRLKNHHDLMLGLDCLFDDGGTGMVGIQGAGRGERAVHYQRFLDRGGVAKAERRCVRVIYAEFDRGNHEPIKEERWA